VNDSKELLDALSGELKPRQVLFYLQLPFEKHGDDRQRAARHIHERIERLAYFIGAINSRVKKGTMTPEEAREFKEDKIGLLEMTTIKDMLELGSVGDPGGSSGGN